MANTIRPRISPEEFEIVKEYRGISTVSKETNMPIEEIDFYWDKTKRFSTKIQNRFYKPRGSGSAIANIDFRSIFKDLIKPVKVELNKAEGLDGLFDRAVYTDAHLNMNPNPTGHSLYGGRWNVSDIYETEDKFINDILINQTSRILYIDDLGDFMDGLKGQTTRGGHVLPQIMSDEDAYDVGVKFKVRMIDALIPYYDKIICHNVCNDNHAGAFGYFVNSAFKDYVELKYGDRVEVINHRKFIDHYIIETKGKYNYCFILCHGKDDKEKKFGMNPKLTDKDQRAIDDYIDENYLCRENLVIEFSKGDSHQKLFDDTSSSRFYYYNYLAFSPSSNYIQTNFKKGKSGYDIFNYKMDKRRPTNNPNEFEWQKQVA